MSRILVGEDDKFLANAYKAKFTKAGFEIQIAQNGEELEAILSTFIPDVILLDLMMPKKDGFAVLKDLKSSDKYKNIPVIVTTNLSQPEDKNKALELGASGYIVKSDTPLQEIVEKLKLYSKT